MLSQVTEMPALRRAPHTTPSHPRHTACLPAGRAERRIQETKSPPKNGGFSFLEQGD